MSFRLKILLGIALIEVLLLGALVFSGLEALTESAGIQLEKRARATARLLATAGHEAIIAEDLATLSAILDEAVRDRDIVFARFVDDRGDLLAQAISAGADGETGSRQGTENGAAIGLTPAQSWGIGFLDHTVRDGVIAVSQPVVVAGAVFGRVDVSLSRYSVAKAQSDALTRMSLIALANLALVAVFALLIGRVLTRQLTLLKDGANKLAHGELGYQIDILSRDELGTTASVMNRMSSDLKDLYENLEKKVAARTHQSDLANRHLKKTIAALRETRDQLIEQEKLASLGRLVAGVAHEINTPVGVGLTAASYLQEETADFNGAMAGGTAGKEDLQAYMDTSMQASEIILHNLNRASALISSFKQVAVDRTNQERRLFNLKDYIAELVVSLAPVLRGKRHEVTVTGDPGIEIDSYPGAISQIITNLVVNAVRHAYGDRQAGCMTIDTTSDDAVFTIEFRDDGKGIPEDNINRIFDPFFTTSRESGGTGLGLNIVYNLTVQLLKGRILCESTAGHGTCFKITCPLSCDADGTVPDHDQGLLERT
ncbi:sensor histidine kinase [Eilatimonas milleporae]|uniref:histidine kinase n=1 Tax=Eilatimonas milleporae TaxID=911205 RepID=A0A3M0C6G0_9PROT|nr:ATP-binding protein [Eilatimonas milleporae]RMB04495.1 signal transduction histidine kinase [Eilatimonas milleporae]